MSIGGCRKEHNLAATDPWNCFGQGHELQDGTRGGRCILRPDDKAAASVAEDTFHFLLFLCALPSKQPLHSSPIAKLSQRPRQQERCALSTGS